MNSLLFLPLFFFFTLAETKILSKVTPSFPHSLILFWLHYRFVFSAGFTACTCSLSPLEVTSPISVSCGGTCFLLFRMAICEHGVSLRQEGHLLIPINQMRSAGAASGVQCPPSGSVLGPRTMPLCLLVRALSIVTFHLSKGHWDTFSIFCPRNAECLRFSTHFHLVPYFLF